MTAFVYDRRHVTRRHGDIAVGLVVDEKPKLGLRDVVHVGAGWCGGCGACKGHTSAQAPVLIGLFQIILRKYFQLHIIIRLFNLAFELQSMRIFRLFGVAGLAVTVSATAALAQQAAPSNLGGPKSVPTLGDALAGIALADQRIADAEAERDSQSGNCSQSA